MPDNNKGRGNNTKRKQPDLQRRLKEIEEREKTVKDRIHKLEASIVATPSLMAGRRLRNWNTVPADEEDAPPAAPARGRTRWQRQRLHKARSRQALTALFLLAVLGLFLFWFYHQLKSNGVL